MKAQNIVVMESLASPKASINTCMVAEQWRYAPSGVKFGERAAGLKGKRPITNC
jgi:hypothetical protein